MEAHRKVCTRYSALLILLLYYFMSGAATRRDRKEAQKKKSLLYLQVLKLGSAALSTRLHEKDTILVRGQKTGAREKALSQRRHWGFLGKGKAVHSEQLGIGQYQ